MRFISRALLAVVLGCATSLVALTGTAVAAPSVTIASLTVLPQAGGELVLWGQAPTDGLPAAIQGRISGQEWHPVTATVTADGSTWFATVPLTTAPYDRGGYFYLRAVRPATGDQAAVTSDPFGVFILGPGNPPFTTVTLPTTTGTHAVGSLLRASAGIWTPTPANLGFRWNRDGVWTGAAGSTYVVKAEDLGHRLTVTAIGFPKTATTLTYRDSRPTGRVVPGTFTAPPPEIVGRAAVGADLRVEFAGWSPAPTSTAYQWRRNGQPIAGATGGTYVVAGEDAGRSLTVAVHAEAPGVAATDVVSAALAVPAVTPPETTFAELMAPAATTPWPTTQVKHTAGLVAPAWTSTVRTRWDAPGAFTHAQVPKPAFTLSSVAYGQDWARAALGAEYPGTNASLKNADVSFTVTARRFAIAYQGTRTMDAMVWVDGRPVAAQPIPSQSPTTGYAPNWITIELPERKTVTVRFAGPIIFTGVDAPAADNVIVRAAAPRLTVGVLSDSFFDVCSEALCHSRAAAPTLSTRTGFRVWNLAEAGTGYLSPSSGPTYGEYRPGVFGSTRRLEAIAAAPIDVLLVNGSINDASAPTYSATAHADAVNRFLTDVARIRPDLPVVLVGIEPLGIWQTASWDTKARAMTANLAATVGRHQNVVGFIDPYTDRWFTGTGSIVSPKGDGNQDRYIGTDGVHPSAAGVAYYVDRIVAELGPMSVPRPD
ncbi:SGNH/GDSL hydrolase family protein [Nocardioides sp. WS12]|uniref:SGNH/GDSL hydrolase family protein n=1 Tax=Nocardioides sp. WS12 TaxID=2486272 RepID=UPI0015FE1A1C|nr:SGNH/GDSL hydrolase family protein [Nocardioides sp. WS12]